MNWWNFEEDAKHHLVERYAQNVDEMWINLGTNTISLIV